MKLNRTIEAGVARATYLQRGARLCGGDSLNHHLALNLNPARLHPEEEIKSKPPAFTLIEMLLAVAIFAIVLLAVLKPFS